MKGLSSKKGNDTEVWLNSQHPYEGDGKRQSIFFNIKFKKVKSTKAKCLVSIYSNKFIQDKSQK